MNLAETEMNAVFYKMKAGDDCQGHRVMSAREWTYPDGTGVRELIWELPSPPGSRRLLMILSQIGDVVNKLLTLSEERSITADSPAHQIKSIPLPVFYFDYVEGGGAENTARMEVRRKVEEKYGLTGSPREGELHEGFGNPAKYEYEDIP